MIYDLIYLSSAEDYERALGKLKETFPRAKVEDASDFIHTYRLCVEDEEIETDEYRRKILDLGMPYLSIDFQTFMMGEPKEALEFVRTWKSNLEKVENG